MCADCGCSISGGEHHHHYDKRLENIYANPQLNDQKTIEVIKKILDKNDHEASHNREHFENNNIFATQFHPEKSGEKGMILYHNLKKKWI